MVVSFVGTMYSTHDVVSIVHSPHSNWPACAVDVVECPQGLVLRTRVVN